MPPGVLVLALGAFAVGTGEFVLAGLVPLLADGFGLTDGAAGQVVTVFAATCAISAPVATTLTARWPRRRVLVAAGAIYLMGAATTALAPTFGLLLASQVVAAIGAGMFIPNASVTAAALVPPAANGRAIATVVSGFTIAVAFGAPAGTAIGAVSGWRITMWGAAALAAIGVAGIARLVPRDTAIGNPGGLRERLRPLAERRVLALLATTLVAFTAVYIPYTYIGAIFAPATGDDGVRLAVLMLTLGITGAVGNLLAGRLADRRGGSAVVTVALVWLICSFMVIAAAHSTYGSAVAAIGFYGVAAFAITTPQQHRLISHDPERASVLIALNQAVLFLAIGASGLVGAVGLDVVGSGDLVWIAAGLAAVAIALSSLGRPTAPASDSETRAGGPRIERVR